MRLLKKKLGFTIVEMVFALSLLSVFGIATGTYISNAFKESNQVADKAEIQNSMGALMNNVERIIKMADIPVLDSLDKNSSFTVNMQGEKYKFSLDTTNNKVNIIKNGNVIQSYEYIESMNVEETSDKRGIKIALTGVGNKYTLSSTYYTRNTGDAPGGAGNGAVSANQYKITFDPNGGYIIGNDFIYVTYNNQYGELPWAEKIGYEFDGWWTEKTGGEKIESTTTVRIEANHTLYAQYKKSAGSNKEGYILVELIPGEGRVLPDGINGASKEVEQKSGDYYDLPDAERIGYTFDGWSTKPYGPVDIKSKTKVPTSDQTLYAQYTAKQYDVTFHGNGGTVEGKQSITKKVTYDSPYGKLPEAVMDGHKHIGWSTNPNGPVDITKDIIVQITSDQTLYAQYVKVGDSTPQYVTVTLNPGQGTCEKEYVVLEVGKPYGELPDATREGYKHNGWYTAPTGGTKIEPTTLVPSGNHTLYAQYTANTYTVTLNGNGGTVNGKSEEKITVTYDKTYGTLPNAVKDGNTFIGWYTAKTGGTKIESTTTVKITSNQTLYAQYGVVEVPVLDHTCTWFDATTVKRSDITKIVIQPNKYSENFTESWIADTATGNGQIMCYINGSELIIAGNGADKIKANPNSEYMFSYNDGKEYTWDEGFVNLEEISGLDNLDTSDVYRMYGMFGGCEKLTSLDLSSFDTGNVNNMSLMFNECKSLTNLSVSNFDTSKVTGMSFMFSQCESLASINIKNFNTSNVQYMNSMFAYCSDLASLDLSNFNTSKVNNSYGMFVGCSGLATIKLGDFNMSNNTDVGDMFSGCSNLVNLNIANLYNVDKVEHMQSMFEGCRLLTSLNLSHLTTSSLKESHSMFEGCTNLKSIDLSNFDTRNTHTNAGWTICNINEMFLNVPNLTTITLGENFKFDGGDGNGSTKLEGTWVSTKDNKTLITEARTTVTTYTKK